MRLCIYYTVNNLGKKQAVGQQRTRGRGGWRRGQRGTAAHWRETCKREADKSKRISYLFNSADLKNTQEGSMTEELIGFISHYLSFSFSRALAFPLSCILVYIFISKHFGLYWTLLRHVPFIYMYLLFCVSLIHSLGSQSTNQCLTNESP